MTTFPTLTPSTRTYSPGAFPHTAHRVYDGSEARVRHSNTVLGVRLRLFFPALTTAELLTVIAHYNGQRGRFLPFAIPTSLLSGITVAAAFTPAGHRWRYAAKPTAEDVSVNGTTPTNLHNLTVELETVPPENTIVPGVRLRMRTSLQAGSAQLGAFLDVITSLSAGDGVDSDPFTAVASLSAGAAAEQDPDFASVALLVPMTGADGSPTFTDVSSFARAITRTAPAEIDDARWPFAGAGSSGLFGTNGRLEATLDTALGTGDWTIECFPYVPTRAAVSAIVTIGAYYQATGLMLYIDIDGKLETYSELGAFFIQSSATLTIGTFPHIALVKASGTITQYINGTPDGSAANSQNLSVVNIRIAAEYYNTTYGPGLVSNMGQFRITRGVARYTSAFTPPTTPFPTS